MENQEASRLYEVWEILSDAADRLWDVYWREFMEICAVAVEENGDYKTDEEPF